MEPRRRARPSQRSRTTTLADRWRLPAVGAIAAITGSWQLGKQSFWHDEGISAVLTKIPWDEFGRFSWEIEPNFALYHLALRLWSYVVPEGEAGLRLLSVVAFIISAGVMYLLVERLLDRTSAIIAGALIAVNLFAVRFAQEARPYAWTMAMVIVSWYTLVLWRDEPRRRYLWWWVATSAVAVALHPYALLVLPAQALCLRGRTVGLRDLGRAAAVLAVFLAALLALLASSGTERFDWIPPATAESVEDAVIALAGERRWLAFAYLGIAFVGGLVAIVRKRSAARDALWIGVGWLIVPILLSLLISAWIRPIFYDRYLIVSLPAIPLLVASALSALPKGGAAVAGTVVVLLAMLPLKDPRPVREDWRGAIAHVIEDVERGDIVTAPPSASGPAKYYLYRYGSYDDVTFVRAAGFGDFWSNRGGDPSQANVWIVTWLPHLESSRAARAQIVSYLTATHRREDGRSFVGVEVLRFRPRGDRV